MRNEIHQIVHHGPGQSYIFSTPTRASTIRREIYRERARLNRETPSGRTTELINALQFTVSGNRLLVHRKSVIPAVQADLSAAIKRNLAP